MLKLYNMETFKNILEGINTVCAIAWPISFILIWVGLFTFDAKMLVYSFCVWGITFSYYFLYESFTNKQFKGRG